MEKLKDVFTTSVSDSRYIRPLRLNYTQAGRVKTWDILEAHDSVSVVVFNTDRKVLVFVKQFRPALYYNNVHPRDRDEQNEINTTKYPATLGISLELCSGIVDNFTRSTLETARDELLEELGYDVTLGSLEKVMAYRAEVGIEGSLRTMYYCQVTDDMKISKGGGVKNEFKETVEMTIPEAERLLQKSGPHPSPPSFLFGVMWFLYFKAARFRKSFERYCRECKL